MLDWTARKVYTKYQNVNFACKYVQALTIFSASEERKKSAPPIASAEDQQDADDGEEREHRGDEEHEGGDGRCAPILPTRVSAARL